MPKRDRNRYREEWKHDHEHCHYRHCRKMGGGIYGLGFIGAAIFYLQQSTSFWIGVLGILKALVWPAFVVYHLLGL